MYNNPYLYQSAMKPNLFSKLFSGGSSGISAGTMTRGINWGNLLNNTQKSLGIINQALPLINQAKPLIANAKTMFKLAGALKSETSSKNNNSNTNTNANTNTNTNNKNNYNTNKPIFYI